MPGSVNEKDVRSAPSARARADAGPSVRAELAVLARLSWPIASAQLLLVSMGLVDTAVLGRVSVVDLAGSSIGRSIGFGTASLLMGVAMGLEPIASQAVGAREPDRAWHALGATLKAGALLWAPVAVLAMGITLALAPLGVEAEVVSRARLYLLGQLPGLGLYGAFIALRTYLQAHGNTRPALVAAIIANLLNWLVCNLLVRGDGALTAIGLPPIGLRGFGALGAGIATTIAEVVLVGIVARSVLFVRASQRPSSRGETRDAPERGSIGAALRVGLPVGFQLLAEGGIFALVALVSGRLGKVVTSAHQIAIGLASFTYMGAIGVSAATAVRVGHAIGEGRSPRRAGLIGIALGAGVQGLGALAFAIFPRALVGVFTEDAEVLSLGVDLVLIAAVFQLFDGTQAVASGALRGAGDVRFAFLANVVAYWVLGLPLALVLGFGAGWGARGLWWGMTFGLIIVAVGLAGRFAILSRRAIGRIEP